MKALNPNTGTYDTIYVKALDTMPVGAEIDFDGDITDIPAGWEAVGNNYSTDEIKTGKTWIDGKPIYRKVVEYTLTATTGFPTFSTGIQNAEHVFIFIEKQYGTDNSQYVSGITSYNGYFTKSNGNFSFNLGNTDATKAEPGQYTFIFEYTKTTD